MLLFPSKKWVKKSKAISAFSSRGSTVRFCDVAGQRIENHVTFTSSNFFVCWVTVSGNAMQSLCESDNTQPGSESSEGSRSFYLDFFFSSFRGNRNIISEDQQRTTVRSLYGFCSSKVDQFEMKNINRRSEEYLKMWCVCRRLTRTTNNNPA